jgi:hypothetical protein
MTSSFRQRLDEHHPPVNTRESPRTVHKPRPPPPTDRHLGSILSHPLFSNARSSASNGQSNDKDKNNLAKLESSKAGGDKKPPLTVLQDAMACGMADAETLLRCLKADRILNRLSRANAGEAMRYSGAGETIVSWFAAASPEQRQLAFGNRRLMAVVMPYMVSDGLHAAVFNWLERLWTSRPATSEGFNTSLHDYLFNIVYEFIASETTYGAGIHSALSLFVQISNMTSVRMSTKPSEAIFALRPAACNLTQWICSNEDILQKSPIPPDLYDKFYSLLDPLMCPAIYKELLLLYHPTSPSPDSALAYARSNAVKTGSSEMYRGRLLRLSFKAADLCLQSGRLSDAQWLLAYAREFLPDQATKPPSVIEDRSSEAISPGLISQLETVLA